MLSYRSAAVALFVALLPAGAPAAATAADTAATAAEGPFDILVAGGNPCVAAHSTVRALYAEYAGPLYKVSRTDGHSADVGPLAAGGYANIAQQAGFCAAGDCNISKVYDQSGKGTHLGQRISCVPGQGCVYHKMVNASRHIIAVAGGVQVAGMWLALPFSHFSSATYMPMIVKTSLKKPRRVQAYTPQVIKTDDVPGATAPPARGWNSWDEWVRALDEKDGLAIAAKMKKFLLPYGYDTLVIDGGWSDTYR